MTGNRLIDRRADAQDGPGKTDHCPFGYDNPHDWCAWRNENERLQKLGLVWIVGQSGVPMLVDDEIASAKRHAEQRREQEDERSRHNWRIMHPVTEQDFAA
ncbi:hypothetical protein [Novosphingobium sp. fls2-241-R2A-195]|uniref:hypothetical protein n=1 Tax=Novosphingobium sp. fls2-241-R2A-195 TaxID=3040296 RepID=UPI002551BF25|nr:hypothetical protein [Novosphingobium sp. fls2-241-R2A-195]